MKKLFVTLLILCAGCSGRNSNVSKSPAPTKTSSQPAPPPSGTPPPSVPEPVPPPTTVTTSPENVTPLPNDWNTPAMPSTAQTEPTKPTEISPPSENLSDLQRLELQRQAVAQEKAALDVAIVNRDNNVHLGQDFLDTLAYGISTGAIGYDVFSKPNSIQKLRNYILRNRRANVAPATAPSISARRAFLRRAGMGVFRASEGAIAVTLGIFALGDLRDTGNDLIVYVKDTNQIVEQRKRLDAAEKNLEAAERNYAAIRQSEVTH